MIYYFHFHRYWHFIKRYANLETKYGFILPVFISEKHNQNNLTILPTHFCLLDSMFKLIFQRPLFIKEKIKFVF